MDFGDVLSRAWQIIWRHKILWIFGIFAGCNASGGGAGNNGLRFSFEGGQGQVPPEFQPYFDRFSQVEPGLIVLFALIALFVILLLIVLFIVLGTIGQIGLIRGTYLADGGATRLEFGDLFSASFRYFWKVLLINIIFGIAVTLLAIVMIVPAIFTCGLAYLCFLPLVWFAALWVEMVIISIVVEDLSLGAAIERGWSIVSSNLGPVIVMALILYLGVSLIIGTILALPFLIIAGPAVVGLIMGNITNLEAAIPGGMAVALLCLVVYIPVLIVLNGILRSFIESAWTLTYLRLRSPRQAVESEIIG